MCSKTGIQWSENMDHEEIMAQYYRDHEKTGVHLCPEWDYMAIHDKSPEFDACLCDLTDIR